MFKVTKATGAYAALVSVVSGTIVWFNFRPLGIFFFSGLVVFWCRQYANLRLQMTPLVEEKLRNACHRALELRAQKPGLFCGAISCLLVLLAFVGHVVSGAYIVVALLVLSIVISTKYDIKIVADREQAPTPLSVNLLDQEVEEFLPEITEANASLLKQVGEEADVSAVYKTDSTISERKSGDGDEDDDDTYSDLLIPQNSIRELDEEEENQSDYSSGDELLLGKEGMRASLMASSTSAGGEIRFKSSHFNANTSSDSDDSISRGLSFDDVPDKGGVVRRKSHHQHSSHSQYEQQQQQQQPPTHEPRPLQQDQLASMLNFLSSAMASASTMSQSQPAPSSSGSGGGSGPRQNRMTVSSAPGAPAGSHRRSYGGGDSTDEDGDSDFEMLNPDELNNA